MTEILGRISICVELGKIDKLSPYPQNMKGEDGADELTENAIQEGVSPSDILEKALIPAMSVVGERFSKNEIFVPQMLMSAKAMSGAMKHIRPFFKSGDAMQKGTFVIGTVLGDLHDIGKNLVSMMIEGAGWEVVDLGVDVSFGKIDGALKDHPGAVVGLSALLTTTMENMRSIVKSIKDNYPGTRVLIGGAPVTDKFCSQIGADFYSPNPQGAVNFLNDEVP